MLTTSWRPIHLIEKTNKWHRNICSTQVKLLPWVNKLLNCVLTLRYIDWTAYQLFNWNCKHFAVLKFKLIVGWGRHVPWSNYISTIDSPTLWRYSKVSIQPCYTSLLIACMILPFIPKKYATKSSQVQINLKGSMIQHSILNMYFKWQAQFA